MAGEYKRILLDLYCTKRQIYLAHARRRSPDHVAEEAVQDVFTRALLHGEKGSIHEAYRKSGSQGLHAVLRIACQRRAKDLQRPAQRLRSLDALPGKALMRRCNQEHAIHLAEVVELVPILAARATEIAGNREPHKVAAGIEDRLLLDLSDTDAAKIHGVRREPVQRGKSWVRDRLKVIYRDAP